jgi:selenoprotein W-related protein
VADRLRDELGIEAELIKGRNGVFEVRVDEDLVAKKTLSGFPTSEQVVESVRAVLSARGG